MPGDNPGARQLPPPDDALRPVEDDRRVRLARLSRRSRELVQLLVRRPELSIRDAAELLGIAQSNARKRLRVEVYPPSGLDVEGRTHMTSLYRDAVDLEAAVE
jgi:hypothetical protein